MAKILILERGRHVTTRRSAQPEEINSHALSIASICLSPAVPDGVLVVAVNPLYYGSPLPNSPLSWRSADQQTAAKYVRSLAVRTKIWALLSDTETRLGFHTRNRLTKLQEQLEEDLV